MNQEQAAAIALEVLKESYPDGKPIKIYQLIGSTSTFNHWVVAVFLSKKTAEKTKRRLERWLRKHNLHYDPDRYRWERLVKILPPDDLNFRYGDRGVSYHIDELELRG